MPSFLIESYKLRLELQRIGSPVQTRRSRVIELASPTMFHGIVEKAVLDFSTNWDSWSGSATVGYYNTANPFAPVLYGWLPSSEFSVWYDVLRAEKPLTLFYELSPIGGASYVGQISLGSSTEPTGEGPEDMSP